MAEQLQRWWETTPLEEMTQEQWESLCDGCGRCCLVKVWQDGEVRHTKVGCRLLDNKTARCKNYPDRQRMVKNCYKVTTDNINTPGLLPETCAYVLVAQGKPLHDWHHLVSGSRDTVVEAGVSIIGWAEANEDGFNLLNMYSYILKTRDE